MGIGYIAAGSVLFSEIVGGCAIRCRNFARRNSQTLTSITANMISNNIDHENKNYLSRTDQWRKLIWKFRKDSNIDDDNNDRSGKKLEQKKHKRTDSIVQNAANIFGTLIEKENHLEVGEASGIHEPNPSEATERELTPNSYPSSYDEMEIIRPPTPYTRIISDEALEVIP